MVFFFFFPPTLSLLPTLHFLIAIVARELPPPPFLDALPPPPIDELAPAASQRTVDAVDEGFTPELDRSPLMVLCQYLCQVAGLPTDTWQVRRFFSEKW